MLPKEYKIPIVGLRIIWEQWWLGNNRERVPPLKKVPSKSVPSNQRTKFSELRYLMQKMENLVKSDGGFIENPNRIEVSKMYQIALASHDNNNM